MCIRDSLYAVLLRRLPAAHAIFDNFKKIHCSSISAQKTAGCPISVSYTHLDVYKRQVEREACQLHEKGFDLAGKRISRVGKGGRDEHTVVLQHPADLGKGFLRLLLNVQRVGHDHHVEGLLHICLLYTSLPST